MSKSSNSFYMIGIAGMILTAISHIVFSILIADPSLHPVFIGLYPTFLTFLIIGTRRKPVLQKIPIEKKRIK